MISSETFGPRWHLFHGDCRVEWPRVASAFKVDAVLSDPPYGMDWDTDTTRFSGGLQGVSRGKEWASRVAGDAEPFDPSPWLGFPRVVLFGANHYAQRLPVGTTLVWIKKQDHNFGTFLSDAEVAWMKGGYGVYCYREQFPPPSRMRENFGEVAHPCQKPVGLGAWCLRRMGVEAGMTVLDPYCGSASFGVSCIESGVNYIGIDDKAENLTVARKRLIAAQRQGRLDFSARG